MGESAYFRRAGTMLEHAATTPDQHRRSGLVAFGALDLGTNNCRLLIGAPAGPGFRVVDSFSRIVRLGEGLHQTGRLGAAAMERALAALHACAERMARRPLRGFRAVATEACRRAGNGEEFLARVRRETGLAIEIISAREEAELALESCAPLLAVPARRALLFDIGGGSTELVWVRLAAAGDGSGNGHAAPGRPSLIGYASIPLGVVTVAERFCAAVGTPSGFAAMVDEVAARLHPFERVHCIAHEIRCGGVQLLGTSGTVTTLAGVVLGLTRYRRAQVDGAVISREDADRAVAALQALGPVGLARHPCIGPDRAEFALPGCAIFAAIHRLWPAPRIVVADRGLREGMLLRLMRARGAGGGSPRRGGGNGAAAGEAPAPPA
jgi:exopolyphosphatase/guanosine-5'-triphosphate,3'-diphosphate pyrophosphatase